MSVKAIPHKDSAADAPKMTEKDQAYVVLSRKVVFVRWSLKQKDLHTAILPNRGLCGVLFDGEKVQWIEARGERYRTHIDRCKDQSESGDQHNDNAVRQFFEDTDNAQQKQHQ